MNSLILRRLSIRRKVIPLNGHPSHPSAEPPALRTLAWASLLLAFTYVFLANHWLGDDAYITFRVVWNFVNGYGLTFNPDERVQAYTHPLWMLLVSAAHFLTREFFFTVSVLSWATCVAAGVVLVRWSGTVLQAVLLTIWLISSKAFVDYTASGLENPLSYLLLALFYARYLSRRHNEIDRRDLRVLVLVASLAFLNRPDAVLLYAFPLADVMWRAIRQLGRRALVPIVLGAAPAVLWLAFATIYYGFPLPNTYYAKVANGIPRGVMARQGFAYLLNSVTWDPLTLGTVALAALVAVRMPWAPRLAAASAVLSVAYTVSIGGDFMSGRFFTLPFLVAALVVVPDMGRVAASWAAGGLVLYTLLMPIVPIRTGPNYDAAWPWRNQNGIKDERGHYHRGTNILFFSPFRDLPDFVFAREGHSFREAPERVAIHGSIGMFGLNAGPDKYVIDRNALSDPLLARTPVSDSVYFEFYAGHYFRDIPDGYVESCERDQNLLTDPLIRDFYERIRNVTRGPILRADRLRDIWFLNAGGAASYARQFAAHRTIQLSLRAENERFRTDVGVVDDIRGTLRSTGRPGLLQYGPGIPLPAGSYRARWVGRVTEPPWTELGFVDAVGDRGRILARQKLVAAGDDSDTHVLAHLDFELRNPARAIEYRMYVNRNVEVLLERVELYSRDVAPADQ
jgi:arabinofuranosyltransferase